MGVPSSSPFTPPTLSPLTVLPASMVKTPQRPLHSPGLLSPAPPPPPSPPRWCCGEINATPEEIQAMAAALQAFNLRHLTRCTRACAPCTSCFGRCAGGRCCRGKQQAQEQGDQQCVDEESKVEAEAVQLIERFHSALPHAHAFLASTGQLPGRVPLRSMSMGAVHKPPTAAAGGMSARGGGDVEQGAAAGGGGGMHRSVSDQGPQRRQQQQRDVSGGRATGRGAPDQGLCCDPLQQQ